MARKLLTAVALAAGSLLWAGGASAAMIAAGSVISLTGSDTFTATSITFQNPANIGNGTNIPGTTGDFATVFPTGCPGCVTMTNINTLTPAGTMLYMATLGTNMTSLTTTGGTPMFTFTPGVPLNNLTVTGTGTLTLPGSVRRREVTS